MRDAFSARLWLLATALRSKRGRKKLALRAQTSFSALSLFSLRYVGRCATNARFKMHRSLEE